MARKFSLHLDALVAIGLLIAAAAGFIAYQRHQYQQVAQESIDHKMEKVILEARLARAEALLAKCAIKEP
jgi:hypothetical protein